MTGPACGHVDHTPGCGPCEAGMARLLHAVQVHGLRQEDCPRCQGAGCPACGGEGEVYAFPVRPGECVDGVCCPLGRIGQELASA